MQLERAKQVSSTVQERGETEEGVVTNECKNCALFDEHSPRYWKAKPVFSARTEALSISQYEEKTFHCKVEEPQSYKYTRKIFSFHSPDDNWFRYDALGVGKYTTKRLLKQQLF